MSGLAGKRALVTGASRGIGAAIAARLAAEGADVALTYERSEERAAEVVRGIEARGRRGLAIRADSADAAAVKRSVEEVASRLGGLDILVNNAGILRGGPLAAMSLADIDATLAVNIRAVVLAAQTAIPHLPRGGRIVTVGSNLAERVPAPNLTLYALSKSALLALTRGLARELGPSGVTVNLVQPGPTDTDMNPDAEGQADEQRARTALGHYGRPEDVAAAVAFLAGPEAGQITGTALTIDGGQNA